MERTKESSGYELEKTAAKVFRKRRM